MSTREIATRLLMMRALKDRIAQADTAMRAAAKDAGFDVAGVRQIGVIGQDQIGSVQVTGAAASWRVTDMAALLKWVKANAPTEVETIEQVRPAYVTKLLGDCKAGALPDGVVPDGVDIIEGSPTLAVRPSADAAEVIERAITDGTLRWADVLALTSGDEVPA
jgi:hypothetical protein